MVEDQGFYDDFAYFSGDGKGCRRNDCAVHDAKRSRDVANVGQQTRRSFCRVSNLRLGDDGHSVALQTRIGARSGIVDINRRM